MFPLVLFLLSCAGCSSCGGGLPSGKPPEGGDTGGDSGDDTAEDTADDTGPVDTGPPPPCDFPETEPNDVTSPQTIPLETWVCGTFSDQFDIEMFETELPEGWVQVWVRAADIGSTADVQILAGDDDGDYTAYREDGYATTDPTLAFPMVGDRDFTIQVRESNSLYGDNYTWQMLVSSIKAPVEWGAVEAESEDESASNDQQSSAEPVTSGVAVYGTIFKADDLDWYSFELPDAETTVDLRIDGWMYGSPAMVDLTLYDPDGEQYVYVDDGVNNYDLDPKTTVTTTRGGTWTLRVRYENDDDLAAQGSDAAWYVLTVTAEAMSGGDTGTTSDDSGATP